MKTKLLLPLILLVCATCTVRAHLIDLTPGGYTWPPPPEFSRTWRHTFFDSCWRGGWISRYGILNGADYFDTNFFTIGDTRFATISWDLTDQPNGFWLTTILVMGEGGWNHLYEASGHQRFIGEGVLTLNGTERIEQIAFYGLNLNQIPDGGATLLLFGFALATFSVWKQQSRGLKGAG